MGDVAAASRQGLAPSVNIRRPAAIRLGLANVHGPRQPAAHTIATACERSRAAIRQGLADAAHVPTHPDTHTIGTACERSLAAIRLAAIVTIPVPRPQAAGRSHDRHRL